MLRKKIFNIAIIAGVTVLLISNYSSISKAEVLYDIDSKGENIKLKHKVKELEGTISLLKDTLDELDRTTPSGVANSWAKGIKTRNGYLQYYSLCDDIKKVFEEKIYKSQHTSWVTGYSSPWVSKYEIIGEEKINQFEYRFDIKFNWSTSVGPKDSTKATITITKINNTWCINNIEWNETMINRIF